MHVSVLLQEILGILNPKPLGVYIDATFGGGGMTKAILEAQETSRVFAFDKDPTAFSHPVARALKEHYQDRITFIHSSFSRMHSFVQEKIDGVIMDLGVSSMQLEIAERGFSFLKDGPLDMRMDPTDTRQKTAQDICQTASQEFLADLFLKYGEEKRGFFLAKKIVAAREKMPFQTTRQLAQFIEDLGLKKGKIHPATRCFQALRIFINQEFHELAQGLYQAELLLKPGAPLIVLSFHSLEDRIVKRFIKERSQTQSNPSRYAPPLQKQLPSPSFEEKKDLIFPKAEEIEINRRARSAKMRVALRTAAPAFPLQLENLDLPKLKAFRAAS